MAKKLYPETDIQNIANAIRTKNGSSDTYTTSEMATAIENIPSGKSESYNAIIKNTGDVFSSRSIFNDMKLIEVPDNITFIWDAFVSYDFLNLSTVKLPNTINKLYESGFYSVQKAIILNSINVPSITENSEGVGEGDYTKLLSNYRKKIYVPDDCLSLYRTTWTNIANRIFPISEYNNNNEIVLEEWDFTGENPLIGKINQNYLINNNVTFSNSGATFISNDSYLKLPSNLIPIAYDLFEYEIDVNIIPENPNPRLFVQSDNFGSTGDRTIGLMYFNNVWDLWTTTTKPTSISNTQYFNNSKIKIKYSYNNYQNYSDFHISLYKNDELILETNNSNNVNLIDFFAISLGSHRNSMAGMIIKGFKITVKNNWDADGC